MCAILCLIFTTRWHLKKSTQFGPPVAACANSFCGVPDWVNVKNGAFTAAGGQLVPSIVNGSAVQFDESGTRKSIGSARLCRGSRRMPPGVSETTRPYARCDTKPRRFPCTSAVHDTYGVLPKNVMSGCEAS